MATGTAAKPYSLTIRGLGLPRKKRIAVFRKAAQFFLEQLQINRLQLNLFVKFHDFKRNDDYHGLCWSEEAGCNPRTFWIEVNRTISFHQQLLTLAHELVHVRQFARNELYDISSTLVRWKKQRYNTDEMNYSEYPWEQQAYLLQETLVKHFLERYGDVLN